MNEETIQSLIVIKLKEKGYSPINQKSVYVSGHCYTSDIYISSTDTAIEVKAERGSFRKGIGQCLSYARAGHKTALFSEEVLNHHIKIFDMLPFPLVKVTRDSFDVELECICNEDMYKTLFKRMFVDEQMSEEKEEYKKASPDVGWLDGQI